MIELIVGRESSVERPRLAVYVNDKPSFFGSPGSVPRGVSRRHCRIVVDEDTNVLIEDITDNNFMYVNGVECKRKKGVSVNDTIELGPSKYRLDLDSILRSISSKQVFDISHLSLVYSRYKNDKMDMQKGQARINVLSAIPGILTMGSMAYAMSLPEGRGNNLRTILYVVAVILLIATLVIRIVYSNKNPKKANEIEEKFRDMYVCPNSLCNRFLGMTPYKELLKNRTCPYCKSRFIEK